MELLGSLKITPTMVRTLAIECYALDKAAYELFLDGTHDDLDGRTREAYQELYAGKVLQLAITLRTLFYQGSDPKSTRCYVFHGGFLEVWQDGNPPKTVDFNAKDVCDKIIHAEEVSRFLEKGVPNPVTYLRGAQGGKKWEQSISISLFAEGVLNWIRDTFGAGA